MATSKIPCSDYFVPGEVVNIHGLSNGMLGNSKIISFAYHVTKKIPANMTASISGLDVDWIRSTNNTYYEKTAAPPIINASFRDVQLYESEISIRFDIPTGIAREIVYAHIAQGTITFS